MVEREAIVKKIERLEEANYNVAEVLSP